MTSDQAFEFEEGRLSKRSISAKALVGDINRGLSDAELMEKYELNHVQLQRIFAQLLKAGYVSREILHGRQEEKKTSSVEFIETHVLATATEPCTLGSPRPAPIEPHSFGLSDHENSISSRDKSLSLSLPLSREEAARVRRKGLILIIASYASLTIFYVAAKLQARMEFPIGLVAFLGAIGWIVTAILGCLWRPERTGPTSDLGHRGTLHGQSYCGGGAVQPI